jgi:hypothetical protein
MQTEMHTTVEPRTSPIPAATLSTEEAELRVAEQRQQRHVRRLKVYASAWALATFALTAVWVLSEWQANGRLRHFGNEGNPGDWNPTLWALGVGTWGLFVGIAAARVYLRRPVTAAEIDREVEQLRLRHPERHGRASLQLRRFARERLEGIRRLRFHAAAWAVGMLVLTPLWALIEWQDNGGFERWSADSQPGSWEPWILYVGGIWALVIAALALRVLFRRLPADAWVDREPAGR